MSVSAAAVIDTVEMPKVGELWRSVFGHECVITGNLSYERHTFYKYKTIFPNGRHYEGLFSPEGVYEGTSVKLADEAPKDHPVFQPEAIAENFKGVVERFAGVPLDAAPKKELRIKKG